MITIKRLNTPVLIEEASALLYEVYIQQQNWQFSVDNPSALRVEIRNNKRVLVDRFIDCAIWFGAFDDDQLVGCVRLLGVDENNQLEVESYLSSQPILSSISLDEKRHCYDISKLATKKNYVGRGIVKRLLLACFRFCQKHQFHVLAFTHNGYLKSLFKKIEFPIKKEQAFKYEPQDTMAVNFYYANYKKSEVNETLKKLEYLEDDLSNNARNIFKALQTVESILPTPFYWMNTKGVVLGINELCLKAIGSTSEIIGKEPYAFYKPEIAEHILKHNAEVISKETILSQEEWVEDVTTKKPKCFSSVKAPLYDDEGAIIGIVGTSIEITAQKEAAQLKLGMEREQKQNEMLRLEKKAQQFLAEQQAKFNKIVDETAHDIRNPLSVINSMLSSCHELPEEKRIRLRKSLNNALNILYNLDSYRTKRSTSASTGVESRQDLLIADYVDEVVDEKKYQYINHPIDFELHITDAGKTAHIDSQPVQLRRALSNLINNAIDALPENRNGVIRISVDANKKWVEITIRDNGIGMSPEAIQKVQQGISFTENKLHGHGLGLQQVGEMLEYNQGKMKIDSTVGEGTAFQLFFPRSTPATWLAKEIVLQPDTILLLLEDDTSLHQSWQLTLHRFVSRYPTFQLKCFVEGEEALRFTQTLTDEERIRVLLLADYELAYQKQNGLQIIIDSQINNAILITGHSSDAEVRKAALDRGINLLPKQFIDKVNIRLAADPYGADTAN